MPSHREAAEVDYEQLYRHGGQDAPIPWDIGEPQPALAELIHAGWCTGSILDIGCGTGELALSLAARGHPTAGVDLAPSAIETARRKAAERGLHVDFRTADATNLDDFDSGFDTVLDSGLLHVLRVQQQRRYLDVLRTVCGTGGRVAVLSFADVPDARTPADRGQTEQWLRELFAEGWEVESLESAHILGIVQDGTEIDEWPRDERGRVLMTGWRLLARRSPPDESRPELA